MGLTQSRRSKRTAKKAVVVTGTSIFDYEVLAGTAEGDDHVVAMKSYQGKGAYLLVNVASK
jgi:hypothetical protein